MESDPFGPQCTGGKGDDTHHCLRAWAGCRIDLVHHPDDACRYQQKIRNDTACEQQGPTCVRLPSLSTVAIRLIRMAIARTQTLWCLTLSISAIT